VITTVAGDGTLGSGGNGGPATAAQLTYPKGVDVDSAGGFYISDEQSNQVRFVGTPVAPANVASPTISGPTTVGSVLTAGAGGWSGTGPVMAYQWRRCDSNVGPQRPLPARRSHNRGGNARQNYERYLALARQAQLAGDEIEMQRCYQFAEHYFRIIRAGNDLERKGRSHARTSGD
jgi:hypothetical protein